MVKLPPCIRAGRRLALPFHRLLSSESRTDYMGFGLLFIGYFFLLFFPVGSIGILPNIAVIGCVIMFFACGRLAYYAPDCKGFRLARHTLMPYFVIALADLALDIAGYIGMNVALNDTYFAKSLALAADIIFGIYAVFLMIGIYKLAKNVELPHLASRTGIILSASILFSLFAAVSDTAAFITLPVNSTAVLAVNYIGFAAFIFEYLAIFLNLAHIFSCYMHICLEGDEDMPYREDIFDRIVAFTKRNKK